MSSSRSTAARQDLKISDPLAEVPVLAPHTAVRVLLSADPALDPLADKLDDAGASVRRVPYLLEDERIGVPSAVEGRCTETRECHLNRPRRQVLTRRSGAHARPAEEAFDAMWRAWAPAERQAPSPTPVAQLAPAEWAGYFPYPEFNPAQTQAVPDVLGGDDNLLIVAPTGAGKTVIGMTAALQAILGQGRKAAWLVPQRSLTDELDRDLDLWRRQGLRIERLSGEHRLDVDRIRDADLWVATTEKFESLCRTASLRDALDDVGALIVDEVHLLGDPARGPVLEGVLARMRDHRVRTRLIGLSATVNNSAEIASWLQARLVPIAWRPSRLTWQLPMIAGYADWNVREAARTRMAAAITRTVTADGGGVLVFCGSKRNVRLTALVVAASRGADVNGVHPDDVKQVREVCRSVRVGLHYKGWEDRLEAEDDFRNRRLDVLVATSTVAAGVNLPARAVVVQDTQMGFNSVDVATVLQMFGRAGRIGAGEQDGWAFLIVDEHEHGDWQAKLIRGYTVQSQILANLPEQVLSEVVQRRIATPADADRWWVRTLAHHQGNRRLGPVRDAVAFLRQAELLAEPAAADQPDQLAPSELGTVTARLMISPAVGDDLRRALREAPVPQNPRDADRLLITVLTTAVPKLAQATAGDSVKPAVARLLASLPPADERHLRDRSGSTAPGGAPGDLALATLLAHVDGEQIPPPHQPVAGIPYSAMYPVLEEAPRYLHWIGSQGLLGTVHPWCAVAAADLGRRLRWRHCGTRRGGGRLLWMLEQMADPADLDQAVPAMWRAAAGRGYAGPDWPAGRAPAGCVLDDREYPALLRDRATDSRLTEYPPHAWVTGPAGAVAVTWSGPHWRTTGLRRGTAEAPYPEGGGPRGAALFTRRGDYRATGWLSAYTP
ncbi:DEAD/DEAH box helicase [Jidongwangia harbinensis]|uniref:DEAD/DEAH box helicase n=1 Tax=Jidongwangia harbinensis TaxID=2878561 RepID=UPI001CDA14EA|nr:DEAD/DEAH box helicase [Jidongwangia harbinensis]MCA2217185.1 DEAD/DEAH box helicase [Jidongwangia harbinensis]